MSPRLPTTARALKSIVIVRGQRVLLDADLARMYGVEVRALNQAVKRNRSRFPADFCFRLRAQDLALLKSQTVISSSAPDHGGRRRSAPMAFTEQGVAMLSGVLHSPRAVRVNIEIMRAFVRMRRLLVEHAELAKRLDELEGRFDKQFQIVFDALRQLIDGAAADEQREPVGFKVT